MLFSCRRKGRRLEGSGCYEGFAHSFVEASTAIIALVTTSNVTLNQVVRQEFY